MVNWSEFQINAHEARLRPKQSVPTTGCDDESELHEQIRQECVRRGWLSFHGSMAHSTFRTEGEPDYVILRDSGGVLMVELKTRKGKLSEAQQGIHAWAHRLGHEIYTLRSFEEFLNLITTTKQP